MMTTTKSMFSSNKSIPIWILVAIALHNSWHLKGIFKYHRYERPADRWDFKVWDLRTPIRVASEDSLVYQHYTHLQWKLFGQIPTKHNDVVATTSIPSFDPFRNETKHTEDLILDTDESNDAPYLYNNHLHQPLSKKNSPFKIFFHVICGSVPIFTGAANLLDFMRTKNGATTKTHRWLGRLFFVFGLITAITGTILAPNMRFSHFKPVMCTCVAGLGIATGASSIFSMQFLRQAIRLRKATKDFDQNNKPTLYKAHILGHRVWALRSWLLMEFFLLWARALMVVNFYLTGNKYSFVIGGIAALLSVPFLLEWTVLWHLRRTGEGSKYRLLGPLPWASTADLLALEKAPLE